MFRRLLSHAAIYGIAAQAPRLAGILTLPIITQHLSSVDYGVAGVVTAYVVALNTLQSLGLSVVMIKSFARHPTRFKWIWRQLHGFLSLWAVPFGLLMSLILWWGIPDEALENRILIIALQVLPMIFLGATEFQAMFFYQMSQRPYPVAIRSFVAGAVTVALNIYTIAVLKLGYMGWFYSNFIASILGFLLYAYPLYFKEKMWPIFRFKCYRVKSALKVSLPVIPHHFSFFLLDTSDKLVMDLVRIPVPRIGIYNIASTFGLYFMSASNALVQAASPFYMQYYAQSADVEGAKKARDMTFGLQVVFLVLTFLLCLWLKELFQILIKNDELQRAYPLAIIILMGYNYKPMYLGAVNQLVYREHTKVLWKVSSVAGIGNVILNLVLVPWFGIEAAALTTFAALMYMGYSGYLLKEYKVSTQANYYPWFWLLVTVAITLGVYSVADSSLVFKVLLTTILGIFVSIGYFLFGKRLSID